MASEPLRILYLEDSEHDADLMRAALTKSGVVCDVWLAATRDQYMAALGSGGFDLILSSGGISGFDGLSALDAARRRYPAIPFVFVLGRASEQSPDHPQATGSVEWVSKSALEELAPAIQRARQGAASNEQQDGLDSHHRSTERLINVVQELSLARDLPTVMAIVRRAARELTGADGATFVLRERELCYYAEENAIAPLWKGKRFPISACISGWAMLNKQPAVIEDIYADSRIPVDAYRPTFVKSLAMVPIRAADPVGAIGNYWASHHKATPEEVKLLQALANSTSIAMENVQLYGELEHRVQERTAQLEAINKELEAFSYSVSHDLRAPLRAIDGFSELLASAKGLDEGGRGYAERIRRAAARMNQLIDDLLRLSRIARSDVKKQTVDLTQMVKDIAMELQGTAPARRVEFTIEDGVAASGDPHLVRVAMENLLSNAWKYTSKKPRARIAFGHSHDNRGQDLYYVQDDGAGFDMKYADKLFGPFQRLHAESEFSGTGVGLATVARVIHKHGGRIWAEAAVDQGATFFFTLS